MPGSMERSKLHVEGPDDQNAIVHVLIQNGTDFDPKPLPPELPEVKSIGSVEKLLDGMEIAIRDSTGRSIGFVIDADSPLSSRWQAVHDRLLRVGVTDLPVHPPSEGFLGQSPRYKARVGVWLMPDNQRDGALEDFLRDLVDQNDPVISHAESATDDAKQRGASFRDVDRLKAVIHAWLAWQEVPGLPYGTAIRAHYFRHDTETATRFVAWFKQLYGLA